VGAIASITLNGRIRELDKLIEKDVEEGDKA
jgi:hypothetical protein